ncbi:unnamed protein product [Mycena citricolor]|uniref:Uncharacterized protein n=1 Tax=Mycena citricolor TaxID=2018698 RepID=A0AAD2JVF9_9AGAR|nr:unnamed protein product [Mycena citricolor]
MMGHHDRIRPNLTEFPQKFVRKSFSTEANTLYYLIYMSRIYVCFSKVRLVASRLALRSAANSLPPVPRLFCTLSIIAATGHAADGLERDMVMI